MTQMGEGNQKQAVVEKVHESIGLNFLSTPIWKSGAQTEIAGGWGSRPLQSCTPAKSSN